MKDRVEIREKYSINLLRKNPDKIFVFGDNMVRVGKAGQARVRDEPNAFGLLTKRIPNNTKQSYLCDGLPLHLCCVMNDIHKLYQLYSMTDLTIVFPHHGLGTGLAKMKEKCPHIYEEMSKELFDKFGYINDPNERKKNG